MANIEVATWDELLAAIANFTDGNTIKLTADINLTQDHPTGVAKISLAANKTYIIDGGYTENGVDKRHVIKGLSNSLDDPDDIFFAADETTGFKLLHLDFLNISLSNGDFYKNTNANAQRVEFTDCRFLGKRTGTSFLVNSPHILFQSCSFEVPWQGLGETTLTWTSLAPKAASASDQTDYTANFCRFIEHYTGWTIPRYSCNTMNTITWSCAFFKMSGCRVEGDMVVSNYAQTSKGSAIPCDILHQENANNYTPTAMNVLDVEITSTTNNTVGGYGYWFGIYVNRVVNSNGDLVSSWTNGYNVSTSTGTKPKPLIATVAEVENAEWLHKHGFDIAYP